MGLCDVALVLQIDSVVFVEGGREERLVDEYLSVKINVHHVFTRKHKGVCVCVYVCVCESGICCARVCRCMMQRCNNTTAYGGAAHRLNTPQLGAAAATAGRRCCGSMDEPTL